MKYKIENILKDNNIPNEIKVRTKNIYGIYKRLHEGEKLSDIHDLFSLKIMVDEIDNCYRGLRYVHSLYHPINSKFKDYICNPKTNMIVVFIQQYLVLKEDLSKHKLERLIWIRLHLSVLLHTLI